MHSSHHPQTGQTAQVSSVDQSDKQRLRSTFRQRRQQDDLSKLNSTIQSNTLQICQQHRVATDQAIGIYWPLAGEIDLRPLRASLHHSLALPVADGSGNLSYKPWQQAPLQHDGCGIPAPAEGDALGPDQLGLLLVPALAVDGTGIRLGYGGGYYDRLRADPAWAAVPAWVVLPSACVTTEPLPRDPWDVPFTGWITEQGAGRPA